MPWTEKIEPAIAALIDHHPTGEAVLLTESDLKVQLCIQLKSALSEEPSSLTVNTESPWYDDDAAPPIFIDVTVFDRDMLRLSYLPGLQRKGYHYDGPSAAIELKFCRYREDIPGILCDIHKLQPLARKLQNHCFVLAVARTNELYDKAAQLIESEYRRTEGAIWHPVTVILSNISIPHSKRRWAFR
jgi:hypothetical protein